MTGPGVLNFHAIIGASLREPHISAMANRQQSRNRELQEERTAEDTSQLGYLLGANGIESANIDNIAYLWHQRWRRVAGTPEKREARRQGERERQRRRRAAGIKCFFWLKLLGNKHCRCPEGERNQAPTGDRTLREKGSRCPGGREKCSRCP